MEYIEKMVSVIVPVYQVREYLPRCIESILGQTYKNFEIILVDDGSDDGSERICEEYSQKNTNIRCIHKKNGGVSSARNTGIDCARGEYLLFVDSDDFIENDYLENAAKALDGEQADIYLCGYQNIIRGGKVRGETYYPSVNDGMWHRADMSAGVMKLFQSTTLHAIGTKIYKREIVVKHGIRFQEKWKYYEDIYFCLCCFAHCDKIYVQNKIMYNYRKDVAGSLSHRWMNFKYYNVYISYLLLYRLIDFKMADGESRKSFSMQYIEQVNLCLNSKIKTEKRYTLNTHRIYRKLSKDRLYNDSYAHMGTQEKIEFIFIHCGCYFMAYLFRKYLFSV